ncbi:hypothetical protein J6590_081315 [Homalodisca vitripennis]|nr:hypothetical protein J6590_081315 [Homalodisca vitripennis]
MVKNYYWSHVPWSYSTAIIVPLDMGSTALFHDFLIDMLALMEPFQTVLPPTVLPPGRIEDLPHGIAHVPDFVQCVDTPKKGAKVTSGAQLVILGFIGSVCTYLEHYWRPLKPGRMRLALILTKML